MKAVMISVALILTPAIATAQPAPPSLKGFEASIVDQLRSEGYAEIKAKNCTTLWTTGEHEYTRWGFRKLLEQKCCDVLQPDITWCGGITEARRIIALRTGFVLFL